MGHGPATEIDRSKITGSMLHFGLRHPEIFTRMSFGHVHGRLRPPLVRPAGRACPGSSGPKGIKTVDGDDAWEMYSVGGYVNKYPDRDIPFLICISATGKDSGHTSRVRLAGRPARLGRAAQGPPDLRRLLEHRPARRAVGQALQHHALGRRPCPPSPTARWTTTPATATPPTATTTAGSTAGCLWDDERRQVGREGPLGDDRLLIARCPDDACTVDVTPRHCATSSPSPARSSTGPTRPSPTARSSRPATVTADKWGLVTLPALQVGKGKNRIKIVAGQ